MAYSKGNQRIYVRSAEREKSIVPEPGNPPSYYGTEISGYLDWINEQGSSPYYPNFPTMTMLIMKLMIVVWGILDGYEMFKYFKQNY